MTGRFHGQVVLVTGAAQGLGAAMAARFAAEQATVVLADVNEAALAAFAEELTAAHPSRVAHARVDVADSGAVDRWVADTADDFGRVDVLVNNAGIIRDARIENTTDEAWSQVLEVCLSGTFHCSRAVLPLMRAAGYGRVLSLTSMCWRGNFGQANYVAAKAGIVGLTRTIALEYARDGVTANAIAPGLIDTPMLASMNAAAREKLAARVPARYVGDPSDVASAAAFLCSQDARYITGVVLDVDGGVSIGSALR